MGESKPAEYVTTKGERWDNYFGIRHRHHGSGYHGSMVPHHEILAELLAQKANAKRLFEALEGAIRQGASWEARLRAEAILDDLRPIYTEGAR